MLLLVIAVLGGCSMTGRGLEQAATGAVALAESPYVTRDPFVTADDAAGAERDRILDEDTIRNAVTSADLDAEGDSTLSWANASTGSSGDISGIEEREVARQICRKFSATREAYDGVTLYQGDLCLDRRTGWWTRILQPRSLEQVG
ncbi:RT0821/Lpp0805 family surface protein [Oricola cellulosilytica]|uniref:RT0821/Lpp0805 family surface protein n=1 Tax=Oricola cellulosilytica TaxID=1429082 RepID=UPI001CBA92C1|nr:RT0821/Lpp0805 family surface protein [Oricola cellulosilytica]